MVGVVEIATAVENGGVDAGNERPKMETGCAVPPVCPHE
jgi:hypothetical protein